jgi:hypothetical protein
MIPFLGFSPDMDPTTPGVITDCSHLIPSEKGMVSAPSPVDAGTDVLVDDCRGAAVLQNTSGTRRTIAGTQSKLYELNSTTWDDVSTGTYTGSSENRWSFAQFGNAAIASNDIVALQASTAGTFATIAGAPIARMIVAAPNFVLAFDTNEATYGDQPDRWWCSAFQDHTSWTATVTTQATTGRLIGSGGAITAAAKFGQQVVAYKATDIFLGSYVGPPIVWQWDQVPGDVGCVGPEAVCDIGGAHVFVGEDNIWLFDGTRPVPIAQGYVRQWFFNDSSPTYRYRTIVSYDKQNGRVWFFYCNTSNTTGTPDSAIVWHRFSKRWGRSNRTVEAVFQYVTPGLTWDTLSALGLSWDALPDVPWDSQSWQAAGRALAFFDSTHDLNTLTGVGSDSSLTTGDYGDDYGALSIRGTRLRFLTEPTSATVVGYTKDGAGATLTVAGSGTMADSKFDMRQTGRFHRFAFSLVGNMETTGFVMDAVKAGRR